MINATPIFRLFANHRSRALKKMRPDEAQERQLLWLLDRAKDTRFGKDHGFSRIRTVADFQKAVPVNSYESFWEAWFKPFFPILQDTTWPGKVRFFAVSSGTSSGATKYIPLTNDMLASNKKAGLDLLVYHLEHFPDSSIFGGINFFLGGSTELVEQAPRIFSGDLSGIVAKTLPWWAQARYFPPRDLALLSDWEKKIDLFARKAPLDEIRLLSGVPAWLLLFIDRLKKVYPHRGSRLHDFFPRLETLVHGGVNFTPYRKQFEDLLEGSRAKLREVYPATEGFVAIADRGPGEGLRLCLDTGIFFEFIPVEELDAPNPTRHWVKNIQTGVNYAVIMSTCAGLWGYKIGDTVRFTETDPPRLLVTGRTSYMMSAFGEHLIGEEIENAIADAAAAISKAVSDYSVGALFPSSASETGGHLFVVEFAEGVPSPAEIEVFRNSLDEGLCRNDDYKAHRSGGFGLRMPEVMVVKRGRFSEWMKSRGKLGGQHKVPRIINDQQLFKGLLAFMTS